ncbi:hypothetical protein HHX47_DHR2001066 [Lentinula edodes]|nr:hypothetical protein HHX47_DHR2001066 [Lentinula edodes]
MIAHTSPYRRNPGYRKRGIAYTALIAILASTMLGATSAFPVPLPPMSQRQKFIGSDTNTTNTASVSGYEHYNANYDKYDPASVTQELEPRGIKITKVASRLAMKLMNSKRKTMGFAYLDINPENYWVCVVTLEEDAPLDIRPYWNGREKWNRRGKGPHMPKTYATFWDGNPNFPNVVVLEFPKKPFVESWVMDAECYADNKLLHKVDWQGWQQYPPLD